MMSGWVFHIEPTRGTRRLYCEKNSLKKQGERPQGTPDMGLEQHDA